MVGPTLLSKGSLVPTSDKVTKEKLDEYVAIHWILGLLEYKWKKPNPNIHDRLFLLKSLVGSGKTTVFIIETFRKFFNTHKYNLDESKEFSKPVDFDYSIYDFPDDEYTIANRKAGIIPVTKTGHKIICSQPKVVLAKSKADEIASEAHNPDLVFGENVGYSTGDNKMTISESSHILYCTMGTLKEMARNKTPLEWMQQYEMIAVDECHERSLDLDEGTAYLREMLYKCAGNPAFPMIVYMSATFDIEKYANYFGTSIANSVLVEGGAISRDFFYLDRDPINVFQAAVDMVMKLHRDNLSDTDTYNDILVFTIGEGEINKIVRGIEAEDKDKELFLTKMSADVHNRGGPELKEITEDTLDQVREKYKRPNIKRRVIVATSVVETGLTVKTLKYVIDTCMVKATLYSPVHNLPCLLTQPCSQSSLEQRGGRAGRIQYGYIYRLLKEESMKQMDEYSRPDIFTSDLAKVMLCLMYVGLEIDQVIKPISNETFKQFLEECDNPFDFKLTEKNEDCKCMYNNVFTKKTQIPENKDFVNGIKLKTYPEQMLDTIPADTYISARNKLISLGFYGTYIGYLASKISRLSVESIRMVMAGLVYGVSINDLITIGMFVDVGEKKFKYEDFAVKKMKDKGNIRPFRSDRLLESIIKPTTIKKHFAGNVSFLKTQLYDEFLEPLLLMKWYANAVRKHNPIGVIEEGKKIGIDFAKIYKFMDCRAQIQESFAKVGIFNTHKEIDFNSDDMFDQIIRIKKCVHAGYKNNIAYLMEDGARYKTNTGLVIAPKDFYISFKPKKIIYGQLFMKLRSQSKYYEVTPTYLCNLDGVI